MFKAIWDLWRHPSRAPPLLTSFTRLVHAMKASSGASSRVPLKRFRITFLLRVPHLGLGSWGPLS